MTTPSDVPQQSSASTRGTLLDVDLPFLKLHTPEALKPTGQRVEFFLDGRPYQVWCVPSTRESDSVVWVRLEEPQQVASVVERLFLQQRMLNREQDRRQVGRYRTRLKVVSPDLPSQRATTYDVSESGLRLVTEKPVPRGHKLRLVVNDGGEPVAVQGECVWATQRMNSLFHLGVRLSP